MLCKKYISHRLLTLQPDNTIADAIVMDKNLSQPFFMIEELGQFMGFISNEILNQEDPTAVVSSLENQYIKVAVRENDHILTALKVMQSLKVIAVPVVDNEGMLAGEISWGSLVDALAKYLSINESQAGIIVVEITPIQYSISEITKIVQSNNADIMQLNTYLDNELGSMVVSIMVNKTDVSGIVATFQRYEYHVKYYFGEEYYDNELQTNYELLMKYINL